MFEAIEGGVQDARGVTITASGCEAGVRATATIGSLRDGGGGL